MDNSKVAFSLYKHIIWTQVHIYMYMHAESTRNTP